MIRGLALACVLWSAGAAAAAEQAELDLLGTWYVLVHYQDDNAPNPEVLRWEDKVWVFAKKGSRLSWSEYPIVVFRDESGRFERRESGQYARVLHHWEPNEAQLADIRDGLEVNDRGLKSKSLRRSDDGAWRSLERARPASATVITYVENWSIENPTTRPVFAREDVLGSASAEGLEGLTRYATAEIDAASGELHGRYERDGTRHGSFRMMRSGATQAVTGSGLTQGERAVQIPGNLGSSADEDTPPEP